MAAQKPKNEETAFGNDSFLDVVANMVGILILLVMVSGLRAGTASQKQTVDNTAAVKKLAKATAHARQIEGETHSLAAEIENLGSYTAEQRMKRDLAAQLLAEHAQQVEEYRKSLDQKSREEYDLLSALASVKADLEKTEQQMAFETSLPKTKAVKVEHYPTPISHIVHGDEVHFQLMGGRITYIPMDDLVSLLKVEARKAVERLNGQPKFTDVIGPIGGFRLQYTLGRVDIPLAMPAGQSGGSVMIAGSVSRLFEFELIPMSDSMGETVEQALAPQSNFRATLSKLDPRKNTVTLWTYPDAFGIYREVKKELYKQGFAVAGRPLPLGQSIGGSPDGTKSAAQ